MDSKLQTFVVSFTSVSIETVYMAAIRDCKIGFNSYWVNLDTDKRRFLCVIVSPCT